MDATARQVVERFLAEVLNGSHPDHAASLIADQAVRLHCDRFRSAFPDLSVLTRRVVTQEDHVAVHLFGSGTHRSVFQGCPPTGRTWQATGTAIYRVQEGRIAEAWVNWDLLAVMEQLGCIERAATVSA